MKGVGLLMFFSLTVVFGRSIDDLLNGFAGGNGSITGGCGLVGDRVIGACPSLIGGKLTGSVGNSILSGVENSSLCSMLLSVTGFILSILVSL